jgi:hypothetical protein
MNSLGLIFRGKNFAYAGEVLDQLQQDYEKGAPLVRKSWSKEVRIPPEHFTDCQIIYNTCQKWDDFLFRIEGPNFGIYSNVQEDLIRLSNRLQTVIEFHAPDPSIADVLVKNVIVVETEPEYEYKVYLSDSAVPGFAVWAETNKDKVKLGPKLKLNIGSKGYLRGFYFWCKNEKVLLLVKMIIGGSIQRIDKLVSKAKLDK